MNLRRITLLVVVTALGAGTGCGSDKDPVLAEVGQNIIRASDLTQAYVRIKPESRPPVVTLEDRKSFLDDLINKQLMEILSQEKYPQVLPRLQTRITRYSEGVLSNMAKDALIRKRVPITAAMKDTIYNDMKRELHIKAMLVPDKDAAEYVYKQIQDGADFSELARDYSSEWPGKGEHGDLGWVSPGMFPYPVDSAVWKAKVGSVVGPFERPRGTYIIQVLGEREKPVASSREEMEELLDQTILEQLYLERTKFVQDSLRAAVKTYYPADGKALLMMKYYWEPPPDQVDNPYRKLDAQRVVPTFTAQEESVVVVDFTGAPDWTARDFVERLSWYPMGMWPTGESEEELVKQLDLMVRDYLYIKAAEDLGFKNEKFQADVDNQLKQMRVNYYYFQDLSPRFAPDSTQIMEYFQQNRERYRAPVSYKMAFFGSRDKDLIGKLAKRWREGASYVELMNQFSDKNDENLLQGMGETEWLFEGQDPLRDEMVAPLKEGGVSDIEMRNDFAMVVKLIARRPSRLYTFPEIADQVRKDANTAITDRKLKEFLDSKRPEYKVRVHEKALMKVAMPDPQTPWQNPNLPATAD
jgi:parvulin-like peptidyl-prolyl isomerase